MIKSYLEDGQFYLIVYGALYMTIGVIFLIVGPFSIKSFSIEHDRFLIIKRLFLIKQKKVDLLDVKSLAFQKGMIGFGKQIELMNLTLYSGKKITVKDFDQTNYSELKEFLIGYPKANTI